uniref:Uncharacterized protein n=1 Tax=Molossus molossus TaxID=27622 RepID=A0A7J8EDZ9_MOLMO|nr:hypothetical protein HJG59_008823 [Molossus molossus]
MGRSLSPFGVHAPQGMWLTALWPPAWPEGPCKGASGAVQLLAMWSVCRGRASERQAPHPLNKPLSPWPLSPFSSSGLIISHLDFISLLSQPLQPSSAPVSGKELGEPAADHRPPPQWALISSHAELQPLTLACKAPQKLIPFFLKAP